VRRKGRCIDELYSTKDTGIRVVMNLELFEDIVAGIHKYLGHYGKKLTLDAVADRYIIELKNSGHVNSTSMRQQLSAYLSATIHSQP